VLSAPVDAWQADDLIATAIAWAAAGESRTIMYANVHVLNTAYEQPALRLALEAADTVYCDGAGVRLGARLLGQRLPERMTAADWIDDFCAAASAAGTTLFLLAGQPGVADQAAKVLANRHPGLRILGTHHGYVAEPAAAGSALAAIEAARPQVVFAGMGTPLQESWVMQNRVRLGARVVWCVGALFDFVTGVQKRGPPWLLRNDLEWAARLASDPRRLWRRYVVGNPLFLLRVARERLRDTSR
jgi:N-acetylglucosaminyldiphosphoundecaprenol N-acetyl-beta-D-mannosaminyltransferase